MLHNRFTTWHFKIIEKVSKCRNSSNSQSNSNKNGSLKMDLEVFTGFKSAIEACYLDWDDYPMPGITYAEDVNPMYHCPFTSFRHSGDSKSENVTQVNSSKAVLNCEHPHSSGLHTNHHHHHHGNHHLPMHITRVPSYDYVSTILEYRNAHACRLSRDGNRSSVSSEGFCENDDDIKFLRKGHGIVRSLDSDSQEGVGSDSGSSDTAASLQQSSNSDRESDGKKEFSKSGKDDEMQSTSGGKEHSRRPSKDESTSSSNSGDEYNVYYFNAKDVGVINDMQKDAQVSSPYILAINGSN